MHSTMVVSMWGIRCKIGIPSCLHRSFYCCMWDLSEGESPVRPLKKRESEYKSCSLQFAQGARALQPYQHKLVLWHPWQQSSRHGWPLTTANLSRPRNQWTKKTQISQFMESAAQGMEEMRKMPTKPCQTWYLGLVLHNWCLLFIDCMNYRIEDVGRKCSTHMSTGLPWFKPSSRSGFFTYMSINQVCLKSLHLFVFLWTVLWKHRRPE